MAEYIEKQALLKKMYASHTVPLLMGHTTDEDVMFKTMVSIVEEQPTADVVEVKQGEWIKFSLGSFDYVDRYQCSVCRNIVLSYPKNIDSFIYCHKCGARMKGGNK